VVHAGAWDVPPAEREAHRAACVAAVHAGWDVLRGGGRAVDAVQTAVMSLEDDPAINAGRGSVLNRDGDVELDAALMDGGPLRIGAVACVRNVANPVRLAAELLGEVEVFLVGEGASAFARACGLALCDPASLVVARERTRLASWREAAARTTEGPGDTVGAVALDVDGHLAAGTSTGGRPGKPPGRVGDAPLPGCGYFADDDLGAAVCTGWGEHIVRAGLARRTAELLRESTAQDASWLAMRELEFRLNGRAGVIALSPNGSIGFAFNTPAMPVAYIDADLAEPVVGGIPRA
jgi:beta-aspartyl-peptidase (threonine type)